MHSVLHWDDAADKMVFQNIPFADHNAMLDPPTVDITGRVLEMLDLLVQRDLLLEPLHLRSRRHVPADAEVAPDDIRDQHAERLTRPAGGADRS